MLIAAGVLIIAALIVGLVVGFILGVQSEALHRDITS